jgi:hypothetical protein
LGLGLFVDASDLRGAGQLDSLVLWQENSNLELFPAPPCQMITNRCDLFTSRIIIGWDLEERKRYFNSQRNIILDFGGDKSFADDLNYDLEVTGRMSKKIS